jgi:hypothetical protein
MTSDFEDDWIVKMIRSGRRMTAMMNCNEGEGRAGEIDR